MSVFTLMRTNPPVPRLSRPPKVTFTLAFILPDRTAAHKDVCFLHVDDGLMCRQPKKDMVVTYSQCCCHYGRGWGPECNNCPPRHSGERTKKKTKKKKTSLLSTSSPAYRTSCVQICSTACVRCTWRPSLTGSRISWPFLPTTTQVKNH